MWGITKEDYRLKENKGKKEKKQEILEREKKIKREERKRKQKLKERENQPFKKFNKSFRFRIP